MSNFHIEFGSDIDTYSNNNFISNSETLTKWLKNAYFFRSARDALRYIAKSSNSSRIFMPILSCESMALPFSQNNYEVIFYPVTENYSIDFNFINNNIKSNDLLLVSNYFCFKNKITSENEDTKLNTLKTKFGIKIIKDYTHTLQDALYTDKSNDDFSIFSVRKWASFPDGGILWSKTPINIKFDEYSPEYFNLKKEAMDLKSKYLQLKDIKIKEKFLELFRKADSLLESNNNIISMSPYSKELLYKIDFEKILKIRLEHLKYLETHSDFIKNYSINTDCSGLYFPIFTNFQKELQTYLASNNIYCPIIWPIDNENKHICEFANNIISHMLAVPCDQRYSYKELDFILNTLKNFCAILENEENK